MSRVLIPGASVLSLPEKLDQHFSVSDVGLPDPDGLHGYRGSISASSNHFQILDGAPNNFAPRTDINSESISYVGKMIVIQDAGHTTYSDIPYDPTGMTSGAVSNKAGNHLVSTIVSVDSDFKGCIIADNAVHDAFVVEWMAGTDARPAFSAALAGLKAQGGGILWWDKPGAFFFGSSNYTSPADGWRYADTIDSSNCHIVFGQHTTILIGAPMGFLCINNGTATNPVFLKFNGGAAGYPGGNIQITTISASVAKGDLTVSVDPATMLDGSGNQLYHKGDWVMLFTGYKVSAWTGFRVPDAQIVQIYGADYTGGAIILQEMASKAMVPENYPASWPPGTTGAPTAGSAAPFGLINITNLLIHNVTLDNLNVESFFYMSIIDGGQVSHFYMNRARINGKSWFAALNYSHVGRYDDITARIDNLGTPRFGGTVGEFAFAVATGCNDVFLTNSSVYSTGGCFGHFHEGATNCGMDHVKLFGYYGGDVGIGVPAISVRGNSHGLRIVNTKVIGFNGLAAVVIGPDCTDGGHIEVEVIRHPTNTYPNDIECAGSTNWELKLINGDQGRIQRLSTNLQALVRQRDSNPNFTGIVSTKSIDSPFGGRGFCGNLIDWSHDWTNKAGSLWASGGTVALTANATDLQDPQGFLEATKAVFTGSGRFLVEFVPTPAANSITGSGTNHNRQFVASFWVYCTTESQIQVYISSAASGVDQAASPTLTQPVTPGLNALYTFNIYPGWQRVFCPIIFYHASATGNQILFQPAYNGFSMAANATCYFWGATLTEGPYAGLTTPTFGSRARYLDADLNTSGGTAIWGVPDDGVSNVQMAGPVAITGDLSVSGSIMSGLNDVQYDSAIVDTFLDTPLFGEGRQGNIIWDYADLTHNYSGVGWVNGGVGTYTGNSTASVDPQGLLHSTQMISTSAGVGNFIQNFITSPTSFAVTGAAANTSRTFTFSVWIKGTTPIMLAIQNANANAVSGTLVTYLAKPSATKWRRFWVTVQFGAGDTGAQVQVLIGNTLDNASGTHYFWGACLQEVPYPLLTTPTDGTAGVPYTYGAFVPGGALTLGTAAALASPTIKGNLQRTSAGLFFTDQTGADIDILHLIQAGNGSPEAVVTGLIGDLYRQRDSAFSDTCLWIKGPGSDNQHGWVPHSYFAIIRGLQATHPTVEIQSALGINTAALVGVDGSIVVPTVGVFGKTTRDHSGSALESAGSAFFNGDNYFPDLAGTDPIPLSLIVTTGKLQALAIDLANAALTSGFLNANRISAGAMTNAVFNALAALTVATIGYLDPTSSVQTQINAIVSDIAAFKAAYNSATYTGNTGSLTYSGTDSGGDTYSGSTASGTFTTGTTSNPA